MIHRRVAPDYDERLDAVVRAIVNGVRPARVILFGSRARGDATPKSDYDLVVELEFDRAEYYAVLSRVSGAAHSVAAHVDVDVLIRAPGELEQWRDDPGYMDWDIARDGIVLYPSNASSDALRPVATNHGRVREQLSYGSIKAWMERIDQNLRMIEMTLNQGESAAWGAAGFHAQQAAEHAPLPSEAEEQAVIAAAQRIIEAAKGCLSTV